MCVPDTDTVKALFKKRHALCQRFLGVEFDAGPTCQFRSHPGCVVDAHRGPSKVARVELPNRFAAMAAGLSMRIHDTIRCGAELKIPAGVIKLKS